MVHIRLDFRKSVQLAHCVFTRNINFKYSIYHTFHALHTSFAVGHNYILALNEQTQLTAGWICLYFFNLQELHKWVQPFRSALFHAGHLDSKLVII